MNFQLLIPLLATSLITIFGWYILHKLTKKREQENKKKDLRIDYLIDAWQKLHTLQTRGYKRSKMISSLKRQLKSLQKEIQLLETEMELLINTNQQELYTRLKTIPGIGKKTAILLIVTTNGFKDFESSRQISSYLGLAPNERSSGSSIRGKTRISKTGNPLVRNHLFLCSFTASIYNPQCKALYERIVAKGKNKKLALIAVCNKLIKQAYGVSKSGLPYDKNYVSKPPFRARCKLFLIV